MYARFKRDQLKSIKKCQLQAQFVNTGVLETLDIANVANKREYQNSKLFPTLVTDDFTWKKDNFLKVSGQRVLRRRQLQNNF